MMGWETKKLEEVAFLQRGFDLTNSNVIDGVYPVVKSNGIDIFHNEFKIVGPGITTGRSGTLGKVFYIKENFWPHNTTLFVKNFFDNDRRYVYYLLQTLNFENYNAGTSVPTLNRNHIHNVEVLVPPLPQQQKIASILGALDDKIELNNQMNQTLGTMAKALFKSWFVDFDPFQDGKFEESELGIIPKGWKVVEINDVIEKFIDNRGKTPPLSDEGIELAEVNNITSGIFPKFNTGKKQKFVSKETYNTWFRAGHPEHLDILFATVGTLPAWSLSPQKKVFCVAQNVIGLRSKKECISQTYLYLTLNTDSFLEQFFGRLITTAQPSIKVSDIKTIKIILPDITIVQQFEKIVIGIIEKIEKNYEEMNNLVLMRDTLLPQLMSGEIELNIAEAS